MEQDCYVVWKVSYTVTYGCIYLHCSVHMAILRCDYSCRLIIAERDAHELVRPPELHEDLVRLHFWQVDPCVP